MKKFTVPCDIGGNKVPFDLYIGHPANGYHPLQFQAQWLSRERAGSIPKEVMDSFEKLWNIAKENDVSFEDLCVYAMGAAKEEKTADAPKEE